MILQLGSQYRVGQIVLRYRQQTGGILVDPVNDTQRREASPSLLLEQAAGQLAQRDGLLVEVGDRADSRRLVNDDQMAVGIHQALRFQGRTRPRPAHRGCVAAGDRTITQSGLAVPSSGGESAFPTQGRTPSTRLGSRWTIRSGSADLSQDRGSANTRICAAGSPSARRSARILAMNSWCRRRALCGCWPRFGRVDSSVASDISMGAAGTPSVTASAGSSEGPGRKTQLTR